MPTTYLTEDKWIAEYDPSSLISLDDDADIAELAEEYVGLEVTSLAGLRKLDPHHLWSQLDPGQLPDGSMAGGSDDDLYSFVPGLKYDWANFVGVHVSLTRWTDDQTCVVVFHSSEDGTNA